MLDPNLNPYSLAVAVASGVVAAGMHGTTVLTSHKAPPKTNDLVGQLIRTFVVGVGACVVVRALPWRFDLLATLLVAAVVGGTLGPKGLRWYLVAALALLSKAVPGVSSVPPPPLDDLPANPPEPTSTPEVTDEKDQ